MTVAAPWHAPALLERHALLLKAALGDSDTALGAYTAWASDFNVADTVDTGEFALLSAVAINLARHGIPLDDEVGMRVRGISRRAWTSNALRLASAREAINALESVGATVAVDASKLSVLMEFNELAVVSLDHVDLWVSTAHAPRSVAALVAIGAKTDSTIEPYFDERSTWQAKLFATFKGCGILLQWDVEHDAALATPATMPLGTNAFRSVPLGDRVWGYLSLMAGIPRTESLPGSTSGEGPDVSDGVIAALGLCGALQAQPDQLEQLAGVVADRAHRADRHGEFVGILSWIMTVDPRPEVAVFSTAFANAVQPQPDPTPELPAPPPSGLLFSVGRRFIDHARVYRNRRVAENASPTAFGFGRYLTGRILQRLRRAVGR